MDYISSDTNVWVDFAEINHLSLPFMLPYIYLMEENAIADELLSPKGLCDDLKSLGLKPTELTDEEYWMVEDLNNKYRKLSNYDCIALAIAKSRKITLLSGDGALRKAALAEGVNVLGTLGILDQLYNGSYIDSSSYLDCLRRFQDLNGGKIRLPASEIQERINQLELTTEQNWLQLS